MAFGPIEVDLAPHAGHEFFMVSDYGVQELHCLTDNDGVSIGNARPDQYAGKLLARHHHCRGLVCDGARVECPDHGEVVAVQKLKA